MSRYETNKVFGVVFNVVYDKINTMLLYSIQYLLYSCCHNHSHVFISDFFFTLMCIHVVCFYFINCHQFTLKLKWLRWPWYHGVSLISVWYPFVEKPEYGVMFKVCHGNGLTYTPNT